MPPRKRIQYTQENIDQQLQQIHLLDPSSSTENAEQLAPIVKQIHVNQQQEQFLRTVQGLIEAKEAEIETICEDNYQDFITSVSTLFTIKSYTTNLREKISTLDGNVSQVGHGLVEKKRALLKSKKTAANLDEAIDTLQSCLRVLDVVNRVGQMVKEEKYWSALRSLEEIQSMPPTSLSQTPLFQHLLSSLPSLRIQIKDAVTASTKQWLLEIRNVSGQVGKLALEAMEARTRRWRTRREKDPMLKLSRVGSAVETVTNEKIEYNVLYNDKIKVDFKPLYQCIHIYSALESLEELQKSYQADRKAQSDLILPVPLNLSALPGLTQEITGFFIVESQVLHTTRNFRSELEIEELWDAIVQRLCVAVEYSLKVESNHDVFLRVKECLIGFIMTLEAYAYSTNQLHSFILVLFEKYATLLEKEFGRRLDEDVLRDDHLPMYITEPSQREEGLATVWVTRAEEDELLKLTLPANLPWSQSFDSCCRDIRNFVQKFYQFMEGVSQHHRNIDELLGKSLDALLVHHVSESIEKRLSGTTTLSQIAQIVTNLEHFDQACSELERSLTSLRSTQRGGTVTLHASSSFGKTIALACGRITSIITSKLDDFFELSEYDFTPQDRENAPSMYLYELVNWLTTVVDSLVVKDAYKDEAYRSAVQYIADCLMEFLLGRSIAMLNENAISNILVDVDFLENELKNIGRSHLSVAFTELRSTTSIVLSDSVQQYLVPAIRQASFPSVKHKRLQALLEKLARFGTSSNIPAVREIGEKRKKEAEAVGRLFPGEGR
ncbi:exocyst complex component, sec15 subunit [Rickenella mellea]|uniref:Exocyst complex component SEC15 n=1 Tax=Rickenella mellea TaxID=50990 RepID=A0A4R5XEI8_9AGAM|nr:exocyst complex component, sec15 subunit [Rickenella mellea]